MEPFSKHLADAAQWIWNNRNKPQYWTWESLRDLNKPPDPLNLTLDYAVAWNIITVLEGKGLLISFPSFQKDGELIAYPFKLNLSDERAWRRACRLPTCKNKLINLWEDLSPKFVWFFVGLLATTLTSIMVYALQRLIDIMWPAP